MMSQRPIPLSQPTAARQPVIPRPPSRRAVFLAVCRMPGLTDADLRAVERALVEASRRVSGEGTLVRYLRSSYAAAERRWLGLFVSTSPETVRRVFGIAQVPDGSVIELAGGTAGGTAGGIAEAAVDLGGLDATAPGPESR
jgi:hypothetical protein